MSPIPSNRYDEAIFAIGIVKKVTGEKRQGVVSTPGRPRVNGTRDRKGHVQSHVASAYKVTLEVYSLVLCLFDILDPGLL